MPFRKQNIRTQKKTSRIINPDELARNTSQHFTPLLTAIFRRILHPQLVKHWPELRAKPSNKMYLFHTYLFTYLLTFILTYKICQ